MIGKNEDATLEQITEGFNTLQKALRTLGEFNIISEILFYNEKILLGFKNGTAGQLEFDEEKWEYNGRIIRGRCNVKITPDIFGVCRLLITETTKDTDKYGTYYRIKT